MRVLLLCVVVAITGCSDPAPTTKATPQPPKKRLDVAETTHNMARGELVVIEVPVAGVKRITEHQTCFLWRDSEFKTASLQCPNDRASYTVDPP
jgi:hypothetical protein